MGIRWRKSSFSEMGDNCLEIAASWGEVLVRESDNPRVVLGTTPAALRALLAVVANEKFGRSV
ncbi:DUF397 domain-containing protein [Streptomyces abikoensis]|uniref:DUF397 domain-containing protein n=1 Tax=Streptomyces abikoensis TaxID=97398 RepID=UPI0033D112E2